jgi:single-strand DNA-binding protein
MNAITLIGRAATDPTIHYYDSGAMRAQFDLLVHRPSDDSPDRFPLEIWGKLAQRAADTIRQGALLGIIGNLRRDDGQGEPPHYCVRVDVLECLGAPRGGEA